MSTGRQPPSRQPTSPTATKDWNWNCPLCDELNDEYHTLSDVQDHIEESHYNE